jgi:hypothetical protein
MEKKIIAALLHTLLETYDNEKVYHADGATFEVDDLIEQYLRVDPPTGRALAMDSYESTFDTLACEFLQELRNQEIVDAYYEFRKILHAGLRRKWPTTKFSNF